MISSTATKRMKVYLVSSDYMLYSFPPLGLAYLAAYIRKKNPLIDIKIFDQTPPKKLLRIIKKNRPSVVGIGAVSENWYAVKRLAKEIKNSYNQTKLVLGGVHVTLQPDCFKDSCFDYAVLGEGEIIFNELIDLIQNNKDTIKNLKKLKGILFRDGAKVINTGKGERIKNLDDIPPPALDLLDMKYYLLPSFYYGLKKTFIVPTSRGCPFSCKYCGSSSFWGREIRFFSAERVVNEIERVYKNYDCNIIFMGDDLFSINENRVKEIISGLEKKGLLGKIKFICSARADVFKESTAELFKKLGVFEIDFGFESGSDKILKWLKGGSASAEANKKAVELCKKYNLNCYGYFMAGTPYETLEDMNKTAEFIKQNCKDNFIIYQTCPYPKTELWNYALKKGIVRNDMFEKKTKDFFDTNFKYLLTEEVSKEEFEQEYNKIRNLRIDLNRNVYLSNIKNINLDVLRDLLSITFIKKAWNLRKRFLNKLRKKT